jgi:hypothetical protein
MQAPSLLTAGKMPVDYGSDGDAASLFLANGSRRRLPEGPADKLPVQKRKVIVTD